jgi:mRNA interferase RelE/StbE
LVFKVLIEKKASKQIEELGDIRNRIIGALSELEKGFSARLDIKKLKGTKNHYRIRVGDYRILFVLESNVIYVYDVSHRRNVYK